MSQTNPIRLMIVDDHQMVIEGIKALLADDPCIRVASSFTRGLAALASLETTITDVVLLDLSLPDISGADLCQHIRTHYPTVQVLGLSTYGEPSLVNQMIKHQVNGYLLKSTTADELMRAIHSVYEHQPYFGSEIRQTLENSARKPAEELPRLTRREQEIVRLIADGQTTPQIADRLFVSPLTVETHRRNLMKKMNVSNAASLIKLVLEKGII